MSRALDVKLSRISRALDTKPSMYRGRRSRDLKKEENRREKLEKRRNAKIAGAILGIAVAILVMAVAIFGIAGAILKKKKTRY